MPHRLSPTHQYIRFAVSPPCADAIAIRKVIQDALDQSFGLVASHTYVDVLWVSEDGKEAVLRSGLRNDTAKLLAAITVSNAAPRLSIVKTSTFLPSLVAVDTLEGGQ